MLKVTAAYGCCNRCSCLYFKIHNSQKHSERSYSLQVDSLCQMVRPPTPFPFPYMATTKAILAATSNHTMHSLKFAKGLPNLDHPQFCMSFASIKFHEYDQTSGLWCQKNRVSTQCTHTQLSSLHDDNHHAGVLSPACPMDACTFGYGITVLML